VNYAASFGSGENVTISGIGFAGGYHTTLRIGHINNLTLDGIRALATRGNDSGSMRFSRTQVGWLTAASTSQWKLGVLELT
jgi:hypothetical protein